MNRLPALRSVTLTTTSVVAVNIGYTEQQHNSALFVAGRELGLFRK